MMLSVSIRVDVICIVDPLGCQIVVEHCFLMHPALATTRSGLSKNS